MREVLITFKGYRSWVLREEEYLEGEQQWDIMALGPNGQLHHASYVTGKDGEQTKELGEPLVVPVWAINAAEATTKLALDLWGQAYRELAADIKASNLAAEVVAAAASDPTLGWGDAIAATNGSDASKLAAEPAEGDTSAWRFLDAWCPDQVPALAEGGRRVSLLASTLPEVCAAVSLNGIELLSVSGGAKGVHVAVLGAAAGAAAEAAGAAGDDVGQPPKVRSFTGVESVEAISEWAKAVPEGMLVLMAVVDPSDAQLTAVFKALTSCLGPKALSPLPRGCRVAVAAGKKGDADWSDSHASAEVASLVLEVP